ncbi:ABC transporter permease [Metabacillus niabensis]|uniref:ABC-2 type transport system permease protein n=1 Tax=Metabacillus niabensis TaxID=324854 RepID=A0ABT9YW95_9BACI|nr:ABC transporter permease [Metabacillus niabensis]MDQ0223867.1 ABC-2 type transport system permease protein [Metabacillus niabensis]
MRIFFAKCKQMIKKPSILLFFLAPAVITMLFGTLLESQQEDLVIPIAIVDEDGSSLSSSIINRVKEQKRLAIIETTIEEADKMLERKEIDSVFVFKKNFQQQLLKEKREEIIEMKIAPSSIAYTIVREVIASEVTRITSSIKAANQVGQIYKQFGMERQEIKEAWNEAFAYSSIEQWEPQPLMTIDYMTGASSSQPVAEDEAIAKPYIGLWGFFTLIICFLQSDWMIKENMLFKRMKTTYQGLPSYLLQTSAAVFFLQAVQACGSFFLFTRLHIVEGESLLLFMMVLYLFFSIGLAIFSASVIHHIGSYYVFGVLISLIMAVFSGSLFPINEIVRDFQAWVSIFPQALLLKPNMMISEEIFKLLLIIAMAILLWGSSIWRLLKSDNN